MEFAAQPQHCVHTKRLLTSLCITSRRVIIRTAIRDDSASSFDPETSVERGNLTHGMPTHVPIHVKRVARLFKSPRPGHLDESFGRTSARTHIKINRGEQREKSESSRWHLG
jgi:hypothetical protein